MESGNCPASSSYQRGACDCAETATEAMEFLARSWSVSAAEISKALANKSITAIGIGIAPQVEPVTQQQQAKGKKVCKARGRGKWWLYNDGVGKKDRVRAEKAEAHAALCVAGLATALASITRRSLQMVEEEEEEEEEENCSNSKVMMSSGAVASATELLASHCAELAQSAGAPPHLLLSVLHSALNVQTPAHLLTLTAAAATALRGEAALKARFSKQPNKTAATVIPYDDNKTTAALTTLKDMLQQVYKGGLHWKQVSIYINTNSQVIIKLKSSHVGGAFSTKNKGVVYGVCNEKGSWPFCKERENSDAYFGVKTAKGLLEFKCNTTIHKQKWVDTIQYLLHTIKTPLH